MALVAAGVPLVAAPGALAATVTVPNGATVGQQVLNDGDVLIVEQGGTINDAAAGVDDAADFSTIAINNAGVINSTANEGVQTWSTTTLTNTGSITGFTHGFQAQIIPVLTNSGEIVALGATGVVAEQIVELHNSGLISGPNGVVGEVVGSIDNTGTIRGLLGLGVGGEAIGSVTNSGIIEGLDLGVVTTAGVIGTIINHGTIQGDTAIESYDAIGTIINSGSILGNSGGVVAGEIGLLANSGTITGSVLASGPATVRNSGQILGGAVEPALSAATLDLDNSGSILSENTGVSAGAINSLLNTGSIRADATGIYGDAIHLITNSGMIKASSPGGEAIQESLADGVDTLLTLNAGSVLVGHVQIATGNDTLNVGDGLNLALTFDTSVPELIETNGNPFVVIGNTVHVVDASALEAATDLTAGLAGGIGGAVGTGLRQGFDELGADGETNLWLEGFGAAGQSGTGRHLLGGVAAGADIGPDADHRFGGFVGGGRGYAAGPANSAALDSLYAGIYGAAQLEGFEFEGVFAAGLIEIDHSRTVANNTVATGLETATGTETAWFLAPQATLRKGFVTADTMWDASLTVGYTGVFSNGYTEAGIAAPLSVDPGASHVIDAKALLSLPYENMQAGGGVLTADLHAGVTGTAAIAPAGGSLGGVAFAAGGTALTAGLTAGAAFDYEFLPGATLYGGVDGRVALDMAFGVAAEAGLKGTF